MDPTQIATMQFVVIASIALGMILTVIAFGIYSLFCDFWKEHQQAQIEAELDRQSDEVRQTILSLAESLAADRDETAKAMTRAMFLTTGQVP